MLRGAHTLSCAQTNGSCLLDACADGDTELTSSNAEVVYNTSHNAWRICQRAPGTGIGAYQTRCIAQDPAANNLPCTPVACGAGHTDLGVSAVFRGYGDIAGTPYGNWEGVRNCIIPSPN